MLTTSSWSLCWRRLKSHHPNSRFWRLQPWKQKIYYVRIWSRQCVIKFFFKNKFSQHSRSCTVETLQTWVGWPSSWRRVRAEKGRIKVKRFNLLLTLSNCWGFNSFCNTKKTAALLTNQPKNHQSRSTASQESQTPLRLNDTQIWSRWPTVTVFLSVTAEALQAPV